MKIVSGQDFKGIQLSNNLQTRNGEVSVISLRIGHQLRGRLLILILIRVMAENGL